MAPFDPAMRSGEDDDLNKALAIERAYRVDLLVSSELIVELKVIEKVLPVHKAQVRTYLRHAGLERGLILNFNEESLRFGIHRVTIQPRQ